VILHKQVGNRYIEKRVNVRLEVQLLPQIIEEAHTKQHTAHPLQPKPRRIHPASQGEREEEEGGKGKGRDRQRQASTRHAKGSADS